MSLNFDNFAAPAGFGAVDENAPEVRAPRSAEFVRVHPEWISPDVLLAKVGSRFYLVHHDLTDRLRGHVFKARLAAVASSDSGTHFLWPIKADIESAMQAAEKAKGEWMRVNWQNASRSYATEVSKDSIPDPIWPFADFSQMAGKAFGDRQLSDPNDAIVKKIVGESAKVDS